MILDNISAWNKVPFCITVPMFLLKEVRSMSLILISSNKIFPLCGFSNPNNNLTKVDLPHPV